MIEILCKGATFRVGDEVGQRLLGLPPEEQERLLLLRNARLGHIDRPQVDLVYWYVARIDGEILARHPASWMTAVKSAREQGWRVWMVRPTWQPKKTAGYSGGLKLPSFPSDEGWYQITFVHETGRLCEDEWLLSQMGGTG